MKLEEGKRTYAARLTGTARLGVVPLRLTVTFPVTAARLFEIKILARIPSPSSNSRTVTAFVLRFGYPFMSFTMLFKAMDALVTVMRRL